MISRLKILRTKIKNQPRPMLVLICGMPGTRKSSTMIQLAAWLGFQISLGTDEIREIMRKYDKDPFLQGVSHDRWKLLGPKTERNFIKGFLKHSEIIKKGVEVILEKSKKNGENLIIEGVHLVPSLYKNLSSFQTFHFILTVSLKQHKENIKDKIIRRHDRQKDVWTQKEDDLIKIQKILVRDSKNYPNIFILESTSPEENVQNILKILKIKL